MLQFSFGAAACEWRCAPCVRRWPMRRCVRRGAVSWCVCVCVCVVGAHHPKCNADERSILRPASLLTCTHAEMCSCRAMLSFCLGTVGRRGIRPRGVLGCETAAAVATATDMGTYTFRSCVGCWKARTTCTCVSKKARRNHGVVHSMTYDPYLKIGAIFWKWNGNAQDPVRKV